MWLFSTAKAIIESSSIRTNRLSKIQWGGWNHMFRDGRTHMVSSASVLWHNNFTTLIQTAQQQSHRFQSTGFFWLWEKSLTLIMTWKDLIQAAHFLWFIDIYLQLTLDNLPHLVKMYTQRGCTPDSTKLWLRQSNNNKSRTNEMPEMLPLLVFAQNMLSGLIQTIYSSLAVQCLCIQ